MYQDIDPGRNNEHYTKSGPVDEQDLRSIAVTRGKTENNPPVIFARVASDLGNTRFRIQRTGLIELQGDRYF